ncbi:MAG: APC family permease, partial [Puniceicoccales bacterium]|nr:APC family permease [Puniceicoccales bacterium]
MGNISSIKKVGTISVFSLAMMNFAAVANLRNLPAMAVYGMSMLFFYGIAVVTFLIPTAVVSAELATGFPEEGGIFNWVNKAMGNRLGFLAVWLQNFTSFMLFPASLVYLAGVIAYVFQVPGLAHNNIYVLAVILLTTWIGTFVSLKGMQIATVITNVGSTLGTFIPGTLIIIFGILWIATGRPSNMEFDVGSIIPKLSGPAQLVLFLNVMLGFSGLEMSASHASDVKNPQRDFPKAILLSSVLIFVLSMLGSMAIAIAIPMKNLTLETGVIDTMDALLSSFGVRWLSPFMAGMMVFGMIAWFITWVSGPPRGMLATARTGNLPLILQKVNKGGMPSAIMIFQALCVTLISFIFVLVPSVETCFWILVAISTQASLLMYILMYISAIILRYKYPDVERGYKVPFGNIGMVTVCVIGILV